jgi:PAS domain S-box-containing protein
MPRVRDGLRGGLLGQVRGAGRIRRMESGPGKHDATGVSVDEALMSALFAAAEAGVYAVDNEGTVIACNPWAERLLGYEPGTLIGVNAHGTLHPLDEESAAVPVQRPILRDVALGKRTSGDRAVLLRADGTPLQVWWSFSTTRLPSASGRDAAPSGTRTARRCASRPNTI